MPFSFDDIKLNLAFPVDPIDPRVDSILPKINPYVLPVGNKNAPEMHSNEDDGYSYQTRKAEQSGVVYYDVDISDGEGQPVGTVWSDNWGLFYFTAGDHTYFYNTEGKWEKLEDGYFYSDPGSHRCFYSPGSEGLMGTARLAGGESAPTTPSPTTSSTPTSTRTATTSDNSSRPTPSIDDGEPSVRIDIPRPPTFDPPRQPVIAQTAPTVPPQPPTVIALSTSSGAGNPAHTPAQPAPVTTTTGVPVSNEGYVTREANPPVASPQIYAGVTVFVAADPEPQGRSDAAHHDAAHHVVAGGQVLHQGEGQLPGGDGSGAVVVAERAGSTTVDANPVQTDGHTANHAHNPSVTPDVSSPQSHSPSGSPALVAVGTGGDAADPQHDTPALPTPFTPFSSGNATGAALATDGRERYTVASVDNHPDSSHGDEQGNSKGRDGDGREGNEEENERSQS